VESPQPRSQRDDKSTEGPSGGPIDYDQTSAERSRHRVARVSPLNGDVNLGRLGDGLVHVPETTARTGRWSRRRSCRSGADQFDRRLALRSRHGISIGQSLPVGRFPSYIYKTTDYGGTWTAITNGLPDDHYVHVVRESPREPRLLFAERVRRSTSASTAARTGNRLRSICPASRCAISRSTPARGQVAIATHGRSFWILDNLALLEALARDPAPSVATVQLFPPETAWLTHAYGGDAGDNEGENPAYGATVFFNIRRVTSARRRSRSRSKTRSGATIRTFDLHIKDKHEKKVDDDLVQWETRSTSTRASCKTSPRSSRA